MSVLDAFFGTWSTARSTFGAGEPESGEQFDNSATLRDLQATVTVAAAGDQWSGAAAAAYDSRNTGHASVIGQLADLDGQLGGHVTTSAQVISSGREALEDIRSWVLAAAQTVAPGPTREQMLLPVAQRGLALLSDVVADSNNQLNSIGARIAMLADEYADVGRGMSNAESHDGAAEERDDTIHAVDFPLSPPRSAEDVGNRRQNEADAFSEVFGRAPSSTLDWQTAAALDPHSYDPESTGVAPAIKVAKIDPVPGQGVVRVGQWIEQRDVISAPGKRDFGNTRTADPKFDPADTKVTTFIDYENGLVVMRQNPSVELDSDGGPGQVKIGVPEASVQQTPDGAVRIQYDAANPFAPDIAKDPPWPMSDNAWTVNGDLVFTPADGGIRIDGTRTDYPSMEVYQDFSDGSSRTVLIDPAIAGNSTGPIVNLPRHHDVGVGGSAFAPFDTGGWNPDFDVRVPLPSTELGPATSPPAVPPEPSAPGATHL